MSGSISNYAHTNDAGLSARELLAKPVGWFCQGSRQNRR
jgi:hypothetical protein